MRTLLLAIFVTSFAIDARAWCYYDSADLKTRCECKSSPAREMREAEKNHIHYTIEDEIKDRNGDVISLALIKEYPPIKSFMVDSPGGITETHWFRAQRTCEDARKIALKELRAIEDEARNANRKRLSPYE